MRSTELFMGMAFFGAGQHNYAHLILDRLLADKVLPSSTSRILRIAQLVNRRGKEGAFEGADHFQETMNKEIQRADTSRASHHVLNRLEDRLSAIAEHARHVKETFASAWSTPLYDRQRKTKGAEKDIEQIKRFASDTHLFDTIPNRRIMVTASNPTHGKDDKLTAKEAANRDAEHGAPPFLLLDVLERGYVKLRKGSLAKWQGRNSGMEIRQLLLENLAEED
ncbi:hypothetical protein A4X06_0g9899, partial [Tilletia controversa]